MTWLAGTWAAVWPNLLASALWGAPAFTVHHVLMRRHVDRQHQRLSDRVRQVVADTDRGARDDSPRRA
ncbi:MAG: hypothetical protein JWP34_5217 [Massilia sp.]|nr:hypothetical protein [Massilia sp.]